MPLGSYKSFDDCVAAQKKKGKSTKSARKICGHIEAMKRRAEKNG